MILKISYKQVMDSNACIKFKFLVCLFSNSESYYEYDTFAVTQAKPNVNFVSKFFLNFSWWLGTKGGDTLTFYSADTF